MRILLVVNAAASSVTARRRRAVEAVLSERHEVEVAATMRRGHALLQARAASRRGVECVAVLGGDGTLNEVVTALAGSRCAVAPLPGGSTNVFARTIGLPHNPVDAARSTSDSLVAGSIRSVGVGRLETHRTGEHARTAEAPRNFVMHTGIGWDAALVDNVERHGWLKRYAGHGLFVWAGLRTQFGGFDRTRPHFSVRFDDGEVVDDGYFTIVLNSDPYTFVGPRPFTVSRAATLDRSFVVLTLRSLDTRVLLGAVKAALADREDLTATPDLHIRTDVDGLTVIRHSNHERAEMAYQVDGDYLGPADRLRFDHVPDAVRLVVPEGAAT